MITNLRKGGKLGMALSVLGLSHIAQEKEPLFSFAFFKGTAAISFKNKGAITEALLKPIWPEDLLTYSEN